jgi:putative Mg2+ transporter-C (MgtC) family protein
MKGLTTAATIWVVAGIGLACGAGMLLEAAIVAGMTLGVLIVLRLLEPVIVPRIIKERKSIVMDVVEAKGQLIDEIYRISERLHIVLSELEISQEPEAKQQIRLICKGPDAKQVAHFIDELRTLPGIHSLQLKVLEA